MPATANGPAGSPKSKPLNVTQSKSSPFTVSQPKSSSIGVTQGGSTGNTSGSATASHSQPAAPTPAVHSASPTPQTQVRTRIVIHTVTVPPSIPNAAYLPSRYRPVRITRFANLGGNIGCEIAGNVVRCDISNRVWKPPPAPKSCTAAWGQGLEVGQSGLGQFVCAGDSVLDPTGDEIRNGFDVAVGDVRCEVRMVGITCFVTKTDHGFTISGTGYSTF